MKKVNNEENEGLLYVIPSFRHSVIFIGTKEYDGATKSLLYEEQKPLPMLPLSASVGYWR